MKTEKENGKKKFIEKEKENEENLGFFLSFLFQFLH